MYDGVERVRQKVRRSSRCLVPILAPVAVALGATASSAEPLDLVQTEYRYLAHEVVDGLETRVEGLIPSAIAATVDRLHLKDRALEYRHPLEGKHYPLELRLRGGRIEGAETRGYGLRFELRF